MNRTENTTKWSENFRNDLRGRARVLAAIKAHRQHGRHDVADDIEAMLDNSNLILLVQPLRLSNSDVA